MLEIEQLFLPSTFLLTHVSMWELGREIAQVHVLQSDLLIHVLEFDLLLVYLKENIV